MSHDLRLNAAQSLFLNANGNGLDTKFRAYVAGFGGGKTFVGCLDLLLFMGMHPSLVQGYFGPTYPSIRDVFYPTFSEAAEMLGFRVAIREANKEVHVYRGRAFYGTVICRSMERAEAIVGFKIARALVDEIDTLKTEKAQAAWNKIIARLRLQVPGVVNGIGVTTTPEGFRFVYRAFADNPKRDYSMVQASTYENAWSLPPDYIPSLLDTYPQELISAYLEGQFVNLTSGTVYRSYNRAANDSTEEIRAGEPLRVGMDFNVGNMAASVFVDREDGWHCVDEIKRGIDTPAMIETLAERYDGHVLTIYPDASGKNASSKGASVSDIGLLRKAGHKIRAKDSNPRVRDRVLAVNKAFERKAIWVNARRCPETAKCLEQQAYDDNGEPDKSSGLDHQNDAFGYPVAFEMPVVKPTFRSSELRI